MPLDPIRLLTPSIVSGAKRADFYDQIPVMLREMLYRLNDEDAEVIKANHASLTALSEQVPAEELVNHVEFIKNLLASLVSDARRRKGGVGDGEFLLPGFNIPKGESLCCCNLGNCHQNEEHISLFHRQPNVGFSISLSDWTCSSSC
jgi:hypothetical protein